MLDIQGTPLQESFKSKAMVRGRPCAKASSDLPPAARLVSALGRWQEPMVDVVVRNRAVNDSALPQFETMQMRCRVTRSVEAI